jgi:hypothetical protein
MPDVEDTPFKWAKTSNGWALVKDGYRIARVEYVRMSLKDSTKAWRITVRGTVAAHVKGITLADAKKITEEALGLESGTSAKEA